MSMLSVNAEDRGWMRVDKSWPSDSTQVLQEIDFKKMSLIESILQQIFGDWQTEEVDEIHQMMIEVSQLLFILQQDPKVTSLAKGLSLQLQSIQEQYNQLFSRREIHFKSLNNQTITGRHPYMRCLPVIVPKYGVYPTVPYL
jgi:hypothetical protein